MSYTVQLYYYRSGGAEDGKISSVLIKPNNRKWVADS